MVAKEPFEGGLAKLTRQGATGHELSVRVGRKRFAVLWDPRESGMVLTANVSHWTEPKDEPIEPHVQSIVLDGLWLVGETHCRLRALLEYDHNLECFLLRRGAGPMVRVTQGLVEISFPDKTAHLVYQNEGLSESGIPFARLIRAGSCWRYPEQRALSEPEWRLVVDMCRDVAHEQFFNTSHPWIFTTADNES